MDSLISFYILSECWLVGPYSRQCAPSAKFYPLAETSSYATGHNSSNNGFFKLVETLLQIYSCLFPHSIYVRGLPLQACHCLAA